MTEATKRPTPTEIWNEVTRRLNAYDDMLAALRNDRTMRVCGRLSPSGARRDHEGGGRSMMTEAEMKKLPCPLTFAAPEIRTPEGHGIREAGPYPCRASGCPAWRWESMGDFEKRPDGEQRHGFCGMASRPE